MTNPHKSVLRPGITHCEYMKVEPRHTVPNVAEDWPGFANMPPVLATAIMIGFIEQTCVQALRPFLTSSQATVGTAVDMAHTAPTPAGFSIRASIKLRQVAGRRLIFDVRAEDDGGLIAAGSHERAVIELDRFVAGLQRRRMSQRPR